MTDQQRVTDEQLSDWANWGPGMVPPGLFVDVVVDLRASRAREAELTAELEHARAEWHRHNERADRYRGLYPRAEEARDGLQQRVNEALALCDAADQFVIVIGGVQQPGNAVGTRKIRAALTGTDPASG